MCILKSNSGAKAVWFARPESRSFEWAGHAYGSGAASGGDCFNAPPLQSLRQLHQRRARRTRQPPNERARRAPRGPFEFKSPSKNVLGRIAASQGHAQGQKHELGLT